KLGQPCTNCMRVIRTHLLHNFVRDIELVVRQSFHNLLMQLFLQGLWRSGLCSRCLCLRNRCRLLLYLIQCLAELGHLITQQLHLGAFRFLRNCDWSLLTLPRLSCALSSLWSLRISSRSFLLSRLLASSSLICESV